MTNLPDKPNAPEPMQEKVVTDDERVREILEKARQNVKRNAQLELESEKITPDLLNFRLRARRNA
jgi:hypothetical protein